MLQYRPPLVPHQGGIFSSQQDENPFLQFVVVAVTWWLQTALGIDLVCVLPRNFNTLIFAMRNMSNPGMQPDLRNGSLTGVGISGALFHCSAPELGVCVWPWARVNLYFGRQILRFAFQQVHGFCKLFIPVQCLSTDIKFNCLACRQWKCHFCPLWLEEEPFMGYWSK